MPIDPNDDAQSAAQNPPVAAPSGDPNAATPGAPAAPAPVASSQQPAPVATPQPAQNGAQQPTQNGQQPTQANGQQSQPMVSNAPATDPSQHPAVQRAGLMYSIAQTLAGGPRYTESVDVNSGKMVRTQVPLSKSDIGLAIAMEALSGGIAGLGEKGPSATGRAAQAGFQQVSQEQKQAEQQRQASANADYARQMQTTELNMRLHQNAIQLGSQNFQTNQAYVGQFADLAKQVQEEHPEVVKGVATYADLPNHDVTKDSAIPFQVVKRLDPSTGEQAVDRYGAPQWDINYLVIDPHFRADSFLSDDDKAEAAKFQLQGFVNGDGKPSNLPQNLPMRLGMALGYKSQIGALTLADNDLNNFNRTLGIDGGNSIVTAVKKDPTLVSALQKFQPLLNATGQNYEHAISELGAKDAQAAGKVLALYGGTQAVRKFDALNTPLQFKSTSDAENILSDPSSTDRQKAQASQFLKQGVTDAATKAGATAAAEARARQAVEGAGTTGASSGNPQFATEQPVNGVRPNYLSSLPPAQSELVRAIGEGRTELSSRTASTKEGAALMQQVTTAYPGYDFSRAPDYAKTRQAFTSGKTADAINSLNTAMGHMQVMYNNATLGGSLPVVGGIERAAGNQSAIDLANSETALVDELGKAYKAGALTDQDVKSWKGRINAWSPSEIKGNAQSFVQLLDSKLSSYEQQWKNGAPPGAVAPIQILSPEARNAYVATTGRQPTTGSGQQQQTRGPVPPSGATMQVKGSDGKMHWSDGKQDLGVIQ